MKLDTLDIQDTIGSSKLNGRKNQYISDCPVCGKVRHLYVNVLTGDWDCKSCGDAGKVIRLFRLFGREDLIEKYRQPLGKFRRVDLEELEIADLEIGNSSLSLDELVLDKVSKPLLSKSIKKGDEFFRYLTKERGFTESYVKENLFWKNFSHWEWDKRVLFPCYESGELVAYTGRDITGTKKPKYRNGEMDFSKVVANIDEVYRGCKVLLTEGILDMHKVRQFSQLYPKMFKDVVCVCTFGKKLSDIQKEKIKIRGAHELIFGYDLEANDVAVNLGMRYKNDFKKVSYAVIPDSQNDYGSASLMAIFFAVKNRVPLQDFAENFITVKNLK